MSSDNEIHDLKLILKSPCVSHCIYLGILKFDNIFWMHIGHCFLLIWNNLFILEEAKAYLGWERIKDMLRNEEHKRLSTDLSSDNNNTVLSKLRNEEFLHLRANYKSCTPWVRLLFCFMALFVTLWDVMLYFTSLYFHITLEKIIGASLAVLIWFLLYR